MLYPKGRPLRDIQVRAEYCPRLEAGDRVARRLAKGDETQFKTVPLETLIDSPVLSGNHFKEIPIGAKDGPPHFLVLACDSAAGLEISDTLKAHYDRLVAEAGAVVRRPPLSFLSFLGSDE